ncbi:pentatricopeptide repeat-containing protein At5g15280, mitochondrial [Nymphaea colorata]|nr:pentatricopeptide repeat-containing protein At5g15280, mitochondrial [Nymphaea colorata]XP_031497728.1 pentatricopeptide repeat-containing protein At5g15280, mitochondrial [Nymphaea colorata]XP_031497736.1 pentatricopeptide repeat-containing protein At5g15280, mitochondrial [Nymphaea colorata]
MMKFRIVSSCRRFSSSISQQFSGIVESVLTRWSDVAVKKVQSFEGVSLATILELFNFLPESIRGLRRVKALNSDDVLKILVSCLEECRVKAFEANIVHSAWNLFIWAPNQNQFGYYHLPQSYNVMLSMLIRGGMIRKAESLLLRMDTEGIVVDSGNLIMLLQEYGNIGDIDSALSMHERMKKRCCSLNSSCYKSLVNCFIGKKIIRPGLTFLVDLLEMTPKIESQDFECVIAALCEEERIQDATAVLRKMVDLGFEPNQYILDKISYGYCAQGDFEGLLNFLNEYLHEPIDNRLCNKIIYSQCRVSGSEKAFMLMKQLINLGFVPDGKIFSILICWCCREGRLRNAMMLFSELILRRLKPDFYVYNSMISGLFTVGLGHHSKEVFFDMIERGIEPDMSTLRVLLAGYCKERKFDDAKWVVHKMASLGLGVSSGSEDGLTAIFLALNLVFNRVKIKRDNTDALSGAEFYDALGNGFYLETDVHTYEETLSAILYDALSLDFESGILKEWSNGNVEIALKLEYRMVRWGQQPSLAAYSAILKGLCAYCSDEAVVGRLLEMPKRYLHQMDREILDLVLQTLIKGKRTSEALLILETMLWRNLPIKNGMHMAVLTGLCKERRQSEFQKCWELAQQDGWVPCLADCRTLVDCLCELGMLREALELLENMSLNYSDSVPFIFGSFIEVLCCHPGFARPAFLLVQEMLKRGLSVDPALYSCLIRGLYKENMILEAIEVLDAMIERAQNPILCRSFQFHTAQRLGHILLEKVLPDTTVHSVLINKLCRMGKISDAIIIFQEIMATGLCLDNAAFDAIVRANCLENNLNEVYGILCAMLKWGIIPSMKTYGNILKMLCLGGKVIDAVAMKDFLLKTRVYSDTSLYNMLIYQLFQISDLPMVMNILNEMHEKGLNMDSVGYNILVVGFSKAGNVSNSLEFLETMIKKDLRPSNRSFRTIFASLCTLGQLDKALELSYKMECRRWAHSSLVQHKLVQGLLEVGRVSEAEQFMDRMEEKGLVPDNIIYDGLVRQFCKHQRLGRAVHLLNSMLRRSNLPTDATYRMIIHGFCHQNSLDHALNFYAEMLHKDLEPGVDTSGAIIYALCDSGRADEAWELLSEMLQRGQDPSVMMYESVIDSFSKMSKLKKGSGALSDMQQHGYRPDFGTHWSFIGSLAKTDGKGNQKKRFLSEYLTHSGFSLTKSLDLGYMARK